ERKAACGNPRGREQRRSRGASGSGERREDSQHSGRQDGSQSGFRSAPADQLRGFLIPGIVGTHAENQSARDRLLQAYQPFVEADLGRGQMLRLSQRRLEWIPDAHRRPLIIPVAQLRSLSLSQRPIWEALVLGVLLIAGAAL